MCERHAQRNYPFSQLLTRTGADACIGVALHDPTGRPIGMLAVLHSHPIEKVYERKHILDIFAARAGAELTRMQAEARLHDLAYRDYLTGLANRAQLYELLSASLVHARTTHTYAALVVLDLDHFKTINDALSHDTGDQVLHSIGHRLQQAAGISAQLARLGGDEFAALMPTELAEPVQARIMVERLAKRMLKKLTTPIFIGERTFIVGASIGIVMFPDGEETEQDILRHAEIALYRAKQLGRGDIQFYSRSMQQGVDKRLRLEAGLRQALEKSELALHFQPQIDQSGNPVGAEALLRWRHSHLGNVAPSDFIPVAEETGLIHSIGRWVFGQACKFLNEWDTAGLRCLDHVAVNVSPWQFGQPNFVRDVLALAQSHELSPESLMLELTESGLLLDPNDAINKLRELRGYGFRVSLDDFGTGYSSLAYLRDLPLDQIKIDKAFVGKLKATGENALVRSMIVIGRHMRLTVVAEGVESQVQRDILATMGCDVFQGDLFCCPLPEPSFREWLGDQPAV